MIDQNQDYLRRCLLILSVMEERARVSSGRISVAEIRAICRVEGVGFPPAEVTGKLRVMTTYGLVYAGRPNHGNYYITGAGRAAVAMSVAKG